MYLREQFSSTKFEPPSLKPFKIYLKSIFDYNKGQRSHLKNAIKVLRFPLRSIGFVSLGTWKRSVSVNNMTPGSRCIQSHKTAYLVDCLAAKKPPIVFYTQRLLGDFFHVISYVHSCYQFYLLMHGIDILSLKN